MWKIVLTEQDLSLKVVAAGSVAFDRVDGTASDNARWEFPGQILIGFWWSFSAFSFVTVASRIVGIIGSSNSPVSGMTIATIHRNSPWCLSIGWTGKVFEPMALVVGGMVCIAAANAGATSRI